MSPPYEIGALPRALGFVTVANIGETQATIFEFGGAIGYRVRDWSPPGFDASAKPIAPRVLKSGEKTTFEVRSPPEVPFELVQSRPANGAARGFAIFGGLIRYRDDSGVVRETSYRRVFDALRSNDFERVEGTEHEYAD